MPVEYRQIFFSLNAFHSCLVEAMPKEHGDTTAACSGLDFAVQNSTDLWSDDSIGKTLALQAQGPGLGPQNRFTEATRWCVPLTPVLGGRGRQKSPANLANFGPVKDCLKRQRG